MTPFDQQASDGPPRGDQLAKGITLGESIPFTCGNERDPSLDLEDAPLDPLHAEQIRAAFDGEWVGADAGAGGEVWDYTGRAS